MSKTTPSTFCGTDFWVYDVAKGVLLAEMIAVAEGSPAQDRPTWLAGLLHDFRVHAAVSDFFLPLDQWAGAHRDEFLALVAAACERLGGKGVITPAEAEAWVMVDDLRVIWRGEDAIDTGPIVEFGAALAAMAEGTYPRAPSGHQWMFGFPGGAVLIRVGRSD